ncbi:hypothetical protein [Tumebacillus permanentifrigoris]|uniref:Uncharacterized protein n=1 Tax=Tumebacillus permanentifrigoris TaxID=378543 RepID=A0A316DCP9_9BACL|nr:hypothetical protein [Tumebacillus permanentifrigoris]PWK14973.1 hypothetical protein C7459_104177 [Tumebacillus permanentifrigoris]
MPTSLAWFSTITLGIITLYHFFRFALVQKERDWISKWATRWMKYIQRTGILRWVRIVLFFTILVVTLTFIGDRDPQAYPNLTTTAQNVTIVDGTLPKSFNTVTTVTENEPDFRRLPIQVGSNGQIPAQAIPSKQTVTQVTAQDDFSKLFMSGATILFLKVFGAVAFSALASFAVTLPFTNPEQLKFFGVEYKMQSEKQAEIVGEYNKLAKVAELCRLSVLKSVAGDVMYEWLQAQCIDHQGNLLLTDALQGVTNLIRTTFEGNQIQVGVGLVTVENGVLDQHSIQGETRTVKRVIREAFELDKAMSWETLRGTFIWAVPIHNVENRPTDSFTILYLYSHMVTFGEADLHMIQTAKKMIENHYDNSLREIAGTA